METDRQPTPYAPVNNVLSVIRRLRERGLPEVLSFGELQRIGIPSGNASRTLVALRYLGLIDDEGRRTSAFDRLGRAKSDEYNEVLAEVVRNAYAQIFAIVDPAENSDIEIADAFRGLQPEAQRERMITLFLGLCREAGIVSGRAPEARPRRRQQAAQEHPQRQRQERQPKSAVRDDDQQDQPVGPDFRLLAGLIQRLPKSGKWTQADRDRWLQAMAANVDVLIDVEGA